MKYFVAIQAKNEHGDTNIIAFAQFKDAVEVIQIGRKLGSYVTAFDLNDIDKGTRNVFPAPNYRSWDGYEHNAMLIIQRHNDAPTPAPKTNRWQMFLWQLLGLSILALFTVIIAVLMGYLLGILINK